MGVIDARRRIMINEPHVIVPSAAMSHVFTTDVVANLKTCKIYFEPLQVGNGEPSVENVRLFSGWNSVALYISPTTNMAEGRTYQCSWQSEIGELYGGYVDLTNGRLVATYKHVILNDPNGWTTSTRAFMYKWGEGIFSDRMIDSATGIGHGNTFGLLCTIALANNNKQWYCRWSAVNGIDFAFRYNTSYANPPTLNDIKNMSLNNQICVVYRLADPVTYNISPNVIKTIRGLNNVWSSSNGNIELSYWAH